MNGRVELKTELVYRPSLPPVVQTKPLIPCLPSMEPAKAENTDLSKSNGPLKASIRWLLENFCLRSYLTEQNEKVSYGPKFEDPDGWHQFQLMLKWRSREFKLKVLKHLPGVAYRCRIDISGICRSVLDHPYLEHAGEHGLTLEWTPANTQSTARGALEINCEVAISATCSNPDAHIIPNGGNAVDGIEDSDIRLGTENIDIQSSNDAVQFDEAHTSYIGEKMEKSKGGEDLTIYYDGGQLKTFRWIMCVFSPDCKEAPHCASIQLDGVTYASLCHVIHWVFTGEIDLEKVCLREVYSAAVHLELEPLVTQCFNTIMKSIQKDLVVDILSSYKSSAQIISNKQILTHLKDHKAYVFESDKWSSFVMKKPRIALGILTHLLESDGKVSASPISYVKTFT